MIVAGWIARLPLYVNLPGRDRGYPAAKIAAWLVVAWIAAGRDAQPPDLDRAGPRADPGWLVLISGGAAVAAVVAAVCARQLAAPAGGRGLCWRCSRSSSACGEQSDLWHGFGGESHGLFQRRAAQPSSPLDPGFRAGTSLATTSAM